jgi:hypothetical protein
LELSKGIGYVIVVDSNARSAAWHDTQNNKSGKTMDEYIISKSLYIMNEESVWTTFHNGRKNINIDLTIVNGELLNDLTNWEICEEDSCSDHSIIKFHIGQYSKRERQHYNYGIRYVVKEQNLNRFAEDLIESVATKCQKGNVHDISRLNNELATQAKETRVLRKQ